MIIIRAKAPFISTTALFIRATGSTGRKRGGAQWTTPMDHGTRASGRLANGMVTANSHYVGNYFFFFVKQNVFMSSWKASLKVRKRAANHDRYEGMWMNDLKEGPGRFIYKTRKQIYEGEWALGSPKCGSLRDMEGSPDPTSGHSPLPQVLFSPFHAHFFFLKDRNYVLKLNFGVNS